LRVAQAWLICQVVMFSISTSTLGSPIISWMRGRTASGLRSGSGPLMS
jgi:hypothetical protein